MLWLGLGPVASHGQGWGSSVGYGSGCCRASWPRGFKLSLSSFALGTLLRCSNMTVAAFCILLADHHAASRHYSYMSTALVRSGCRWCFAAGYSLTSILSRQVRLRAEAGGGGDARRRQRRGGGQHRLHQLLHRTAGLRALQHQQRCAITKRLRAGQQLVSDSFDSDATVLQRLHGIVMLWSGLRISRMSHRWDG